MITHLKFAEAMRLALRVGILEESEGKDEVIIKLVDGSALHFKSNYDEDYSSNTPGNGIEPPHVYHEISEPQLTESEKYLKELNEIHNPLRYLKWK